MDIHNSKRALNVEITFKLLYEETNEVKLNDHLKQDMTAVCKQTNMKGLWEKSRIIRVFQNSRSTQKWKTMCMMGCVVCSVIKG
jgi:hypothetical protein